MRDAAAYPVYSALVIVLLTSTFWRLSRETGKGDVFSYSTQEEKSEVNNDKEKQRVSCTFDQLLTGGKWIQIDIDDTANSASPSSSLPLLMQGYEYCQVDLRQDCRASKRTPGKTFAYTTRTRKRLIWQPAAPRCSLHQYTSSEALNCLQNRHILFLGDSLARNFQQALQCGLLTAPEPPMPFTDGYKLDYNSFFPEKNSSVRFSSSAFLDRVSLTNIVSSLKDTPITDVIVSTGPWWSPKSFEQELGSIDSVVVVPDDAVSTDTAPTSFSFKRNREGKPVTWWDWSWVFEGGDEGAKHFLQLKMKQMMKNVITLIPSHVRIVWRTPDVSHESSHYKENVATPGKPTGCEHFVGYGEHDLNGVSSNVRYQDSVRFIWWLHEQLVQSVRNTRIELMDVKELSLGRPDAHPSAHIREIHVPIIDANGTKVGEKMREVGDCMHWCLGIEDSVPDTWVMLYLNRLCGNNQK